MENEAVVKHESQMPAVQPAERMIIMIMDAARDKTIDIDKLERLMAMQERMVADGRRVAFVEAMTRLAPILPRVAKHGTNTHQNSRYALLTDIDVAIRPALTQEGFSLSFDSGPVEGAPGKMRVFLKCSHIGGHSETIHIDLALDKSGSKNETQAGPSTIAYGRAVLTKMFFNLMTEADNTDGEDSSFITDEQAREINTLIADTKSDKKRFLQLIAGVDKIEDIPARDFKRVINALQTKQREQKPQ